MKRIICLALGLAACGGGPRTENSASCGFAAIAGSNLVLQQFQKRTTVMSDAPKGLDTSLVATRVVGYGTSASLAATSPKGIVLGYEGAGFPQRPGFAVALVDDSSEALHGVLVFESDGPVDYPQIGIISTATSTLPLYAMRVSWSDVSDRKCPLIGSVPDSLKR